VKFLTILIELLIISLISQAKVNGSPSYQFMVIFAIQGKIIKFKRKHKTGKMSDKRFQGLIALAVSFPRRKVSFDKCQD
jgi:hypothetical protein